MKKWMLVTAVLIMNLAWAAPVLADDSLFGRRPAQVGEIRFSDVPAASHDCDAKIKKLEAEVPPAPTAPQKAQQG